MKRKNSITELVNRFFTAIFKRETPETHPLFLEVLRKYISQEISNNKLKESTIRKYEGFLQNIETFFKLRKLDQLTCMQVKIKHMSELKTYLHQNLRQCSLTHSARHLELCKRALRFGVQQELVPYNTLESLETDRDPIKEVISIEHTEFLKLLHARFENDIYTIAQQLYIFQVVTGLSYADLWSYCVMQDKRGKDWICGRRQKTGIEYNVPYHPLARQIHEHYDGKLPVITNAAYNRVLKEIAKQIGINKVITTHTARKSFATMNYEKGWSLEGLRLMLGQNSTRTTEKHYARPSRARIENEAERLKLVYS